MNTVMLTVKQIESHYHPLRTLYDATLFVNSISLPYTQKRNKIYALYEEGYVMIEISEHGEIKGYTDAQTLEQYEGSLDLFVKNTKDNEETLGFLAMSDSAFIVLRLNGIFDKELLEFGGLAVRRELI